ncbi:MAG: hypothetical protein KAU48_06845 [Candidatus Thorarchaeota archaeon]|nr:hypothetical protein [Candidatus Thorarchaeota archaeon]
MKEFHLIGVRLMNNISEIVNQLVDLYLFYKPRSKKAIVKKIQEIADYYQINQTQAADIFNLDQYITIKLGLFSKGNLSTGIINDWAIHEEAGYLSTEAQTNLLEYVNKTFLHLMQEMQELWDDPSRSILSVFSAAKQWLQFHPSQSLYDLVQTIMSSKRTGFLREKLLEESILWALFKYIDYGLTGRWAHGTTYHTDRAEFRSIVQNHREAASWLVEDLRSGSIPKDDSGKVYYGYSILHGFVFPLPKKPMLLDNGIRLRETTQLEWGQLLQTKETTRGPLSSAVEYLDRIPTFKAKPPILEIWEKETSEEIRQKQADPISELFPPAINRIRSKMGDVLTCIRLSSSEKPGILDTLIPEEATPYLQLKPTRIQSEFEFIEYEKRGGSAKERTKPSQSIEHTFGLGHLRDFWTVYISFKACKPTPFNKHFESALSWFNKSFSEPFEEDSIIDLVVSLETLTKSTGSVISYIILPLLNVKSDYKSILQDIRQFFDLRNKILHGSTEYLEKYDLFRWANWGQSIVAAVLRNIIFYSTKHGLPTKKKPLRVILDNCVADQSECKKIQEAIPSWSYIRVEDC